MDKHYTSTYDPELLETLSFFCFSHLKDDYDGTCMFELSYPDGKVAKKAVRVHPTNGVQVFHGEPSDGVVTCRTAMKRDTFFDVYMAKISPRQAIVNGDVKVQGWAFREMARFGGSFDFRTERWDDFYTWRKTQPRDTLTLSSYRLKPLPFSLPRPHSSSDSSADLLSSFTFQIPILSFLFSPAPSIAVCESSESYPLGASSITQSVVSAPSVAFSPEHVQKAFASIQTHRTHVVPAGATTIVDSLLGEKKEDIHPVLSSISAYVQQMGNRVAARRSQVITRSESWLVAMRRRGNKPVEPGEPGAWVQELVDNFELSSMGSLMTEGV